MYDVRSIFFPENRRVSNPFQYNNLLITVAIPLHMLFFYFYLANVENWSFIVSKWNLVPLLVWNVIIMSLPLFSLDFRFITFRTGACINQGFEQYFNWLITNTIRKCVCVCFFFPRWNDYVVKAWKPLNFFFLLKIEEEIRKSPYR